MTIDTFLIQRAAAGLPAGGAPVLSLGVVSLGPLLGSTGTRAGLRARSAAHAALKAGEQHLTNIPEAYRYAHPDVAPNVLPEVRTALTAALRDRTLAQFRSPVDGYVGVAERALADAEAAADRYRPKLDLESPTQMMRTDQAWNNHIKPMLEAGKQWDQIIPTLDTDGILAARRFAPGYEARTRDQFHQHEVPSVIAGIQIMSERRVVDIAPPDAREVLREAQDAATSLQFVKSVESWVAAADHRNAASVSIGLTRAAFQSGAQVPVDTSPEAKDAYQSMLRKGGAE